MSLHQFLFAPGTWVGEGRVTLSGSPERIHYYTKWIVKAIEKNAINVKQEVEMQGGGENVMNHFHFSSVTHDTFNLTLQNELLGEAQGKGIIEPKKIAWEILGHPDFEGFEVYELQENGDYMVHAEYISPDQHRTTIDGRIWKKATV